MCLIPAIDSVGILSSVSGNTTRKSTNLRFVNLHCKISRRTQAKRSLKDAGYRTETRRKKEYSFHEFAPAFGFLLKGAVLHLTGKCCKGKAFLSWILKMSSCSSGPFRFVLVCAREPAVIRPMYWRGVP